jgi:hypothetical protein
LQAVGRSARRGRPGSVTVFGFHRYKEGYFPQRRVAEKNIFSLQVKSWIQSFIFLFIYLFIFLMSIFYLHIKEKYDYMLHSERSWVLNGEEPDLEVTYRFARQPLDVLYCARDMLLEKKIPTQKDGENILRMAVWNVFFFFSLSLSLSLSLSPSLSLALSFLFFVFYFFFYFFLFFIF